MEQALTMSLAIEADWEQSTCGSPEERACFAELGIRYDGIWLTQANDAFVKRVRDRVHLSAYPLGEWLAWNWWRLRWEPQARDLDWEMAHRMTSIGGGYIWPNITIVSDGERVALVTKPTRPRPEEPLRYITDIVVVVRALEFEDAVDRFLDQIQGQLRAENIADTNLHRIWQEVLAERADPARSQRRRLEAMLGFDPGEGNEETIERLERDASMLGTDAMIEVAAAHGEGGDIVTADRLREVATQSGYEAMPGNVVRLAAVAQLPPTGHAPAWKRGAAAARALRSQQQLGAVPISNARLAELAGVEATVLADRVAGPDFSFALDRTPQLGRVVLRSKWETGRRFELARLLGDRVAGNSDGRFFPATRAYTYRQKMQRSFAAELLCPFDAMEDMLRGDYSSESIEDAAEQFNVSERTVRTLLVNHGRLDRDELAGDFDTAAAA
jgi:hypothetical protein